MDEKPAPTRTSAPISRLARPSRGRRGTVREQRHDKDGVTHDDESQPDRV